MSRPSRVCTITGTRAQRCSCGVLLDPFAGVGGNAIQFARTCGRVLASDSSAARLRLARHNAGIYGVADHIDFRCADFSEALGTAQVRRCVLLIV